MRVPVVRPLFLVALLALASAACGPAAQPSPTAAPAKPAAATEAPKPAASPATAAKPAEPKPAASPAAKAEAQPAASPAAKAAAKPLPKVGGTVNVLAVWGGDEQASFMAMVKPFEDQTGTRVQFEGTRDVGAVLTTRVQGGNPPDVAGLPGPGQMAQFARQGRLIPLDNALDMSAMRQDYAEDWLKLGQADGKQVGIFIKSSLKGLVWYNPKAFSQGGYQTPKTWDEMMALSQRIAGTGVTPWCIGLEAAAASGWPGTDWLENIALRQIGPDAYDQWHQGKLKWSSPEIKKAWETWGQIVADPKMVLGGRQGMLATSFQTGGNGLFGSPPRCYLHHQASFITNFFQEANPNLRPVEDFNFFGFPDIDPRYTSTIEGAGDLFGMFKDTPQARALMQWLVTPEAQEIWVKRGGALSANKRVPLDSYPDQLSKLSAQLLTSARSVRFDASDLMPEAMNNAFWKAILDYVNNPGNLDNVLASLDRVQADAYRP
jgi:alpha-glucoside transport system substrate-binding protein